MAYLSEPKIESTPYFPPDVGQLLQARNQEVGVILPGRNRLKIKNAQRFVVYEERRRLKCEPVIDAECIHADALRFQRCQVTLADDSNGVCIRRMEFDNLLNHALQFVEF